MIEPIANSPYALRFDSAGTDPADGHYAEDWTSVLKLVGEDYVPIRRFSSRGDAIHYVSSMLRAAERRRESEGQNNAT